MRVCGSWKSEQFRFIVPNTAKALFFIADTRGLNNSLGSNKTPKSLINKERCELTSVIQWLK